MPAASAATASPGASLAAVSLHCNLLGSASGAPAGVGALGWGQGGPSPVLAGLGLDYVTTISMGVSAADTAK